MQLNPPEKNASTEGPDDPPPPANNSAFRRLTKRLLGVTVQEVKDAEKKWQETRMKR